MAACGFSSAMAQHFEDLQERVEEARFFREDVTHDPGSRPSLYKFTFYIKEELMKKKNMKR